MHEQILGYGCILFKIKYTTFIYGDVSISGEEMRNVGFCLALMEQEGSLSFHSCGDTGTRFLRSHLKDHPIKSPCPTSKGYYDPILSQVSTGTRTMSLKDVQDTRTEKKIFYEPLLKKKNGFVLHVYVCDMC